MVCLKSIKSINLYFLLYVAVILNRNKDTLRFNLMGKTFMKKQGF